MNSDKLRQDFFIELWKSYKNETPVVEKIENLLLTREHQIFSDHIAFQTLSGKTSGLDVWADLFSQWGYQGRGEYFFEHQKVKGRHFEFPEDNKLPKIFIRELWPELFCASAQSVLKRLGRQLQQPLSSGVFHQERPWPVKYAEYELLAQESPYAAWFYAHGLKVHHFALNVNELETFDSTADLNLFLDEGGVLLDSRDGKIQGGPRDHLERSRTVPESIWVEFEEGPRLVPCGHFEFIRRYEDDSGHLFQGFVTDTDLSQGRFDSGAILRP